MQYILTLFLSCLILTLGASEFQSKGHPLKVLHLTFHKGCQQEINALAEEFHFDLTTWFIPDLPPFWFDGQAQGSALYNIGHHRAKRIWKKHKDAFESFDLIITSDTTPLARIFLQNKWKKPLIIWMCNRFDYADHSTLDCVFPDGEYYTLMHKALSQKNVRVVAYTEFEHAYARSKGVETGTLTITPGISVAEMKDSIIPEAIDKYETFFIPPYHNETIFMNFSTHCTSLGIPNFNGRYNGPYDLKDFKGIIHLPYAWSNLALFENMQLGIPYFVPTQKFFFELLCQPNYFHQDAHFTKDWLHLSEWYNAEHQPFLIYFNSWKDLQDKIEQTDYLEYKGRIKAHAYEYRERQLKKWHKILKELVN